MVQKFVCQFEKTELTKLTQKETENIKFFLEIRNQRKMPSITISQQHCTRGSSQCNKARERKGASAAKEKVKLPLFADNIVIYSEKQMSTQDVLELMNLVSLSETRSI